MLVVLLEEELDEDVEVVDVDEVVELDADGALEDEEDVALGALVEDAVLVADEVGDAVPLDDEDVGDAVGAA